MQEGKESWTITDDLGPFHLSALLILADSQLRATALSKIENGALYKQHISFEVSDFSLKCIHLALIVNNHYHQEYYNWPISTVIKMSG